MSDKPGIPAWQSASNSSTPPADPESTTSEQSEQPEQPEHPEHPEQPVEDSATPVAGELTSTESDEETSSPSLLEQASRFLDDPTIRDAPREKKVAFLQSKNVAPEDIESLLETATEVSTSPDLEELGERTWAVAPQNPAQAPAPIPQPRELPPIVTYPEFLAQTEQPPPLITTKRLLTTAYVAGGLMSTIYGLSKFIIGPMAQNLAESRHDFATHTQDQLKEFNQKLGDLVSVDPASVSKTSASEMGDDVSEADSDPTELYHRDYGTQTTPNLSRRPSHSSNPDPEPIVSAQEDRLKKISAHLREITANKTHDRVSAGSVRTKVSDLTSYLSEMSYQNQYYSSSNNFYGSSFSLPSGKDGKNDQIEVLKNDIRAVKGVFLSARNFPVGGQSVSPMPMGKADRSGTCITMQSFTSKLPFGQSKPSHEDETSLTTLLTADQCADLTFLIATITATMRQSLLDTFTAEETPLDATPSQSEEQALATEPSDSANVSDGDKIKKQRESREADTRQELAKPEVQELKKAMLAYFDGWRGKVIGRVGEIVNSRHEAKEQTKHVKGEKVEELVKKSEAVTTSIRDLGEGAEDEDTAFKALYPPIDTVLTDLEENKRALILHSLVLILLSLETYSAHSRILVLHLTSSLNLSLSILKKDEETVAQGLLEAASQQLNADAETKKAAEASQTARKWKVGLASVAGAALIGVTGGLAAPLLAAGVGSVMGGLGLGATAAAGYLGTLAGSSVLVGGLFGAYGAKMTGRAMDDYARQVEDFAFLPIHHSQDPEKQDNGARRLRVAIAISGWLREPDEVVAPWRYIGTSTEGFALRWELDALLNLGHSLETFVMSKAWGYAKAKIIEQTIFAALMAGLWPLSLLKMASLLDNPYSLAKYRAEKAGEVLADALINKVQGERPVTLVGYSLGARLIFTCLHKLAERKAFGLVENVVLLGAACPSDAADWRSIRAVVSGRVVNVFSKQDYILGFLYRTSSIQLGVAGLQPVLGVHGVQNVDVSELVDGHLQYRFITGSILRKIGFEDVDVHEVERAESEMAAQKAKEEKEKNQRDGEPVTEEDAEEEKKRLETEVKKKNEQSYLQIMQQKTKNIDIGGFLSGKGGKAEPEKVEHKAGPKTD
ncbi:DUF726-domain-containing protein [Dothidotthia symphoricarpi CBS 119687]|uniref:DUF726-domain-containing protein n=1 Tax=Dothidotthia symphoricarpi CBS 119687 TaxID=1392245 RepID=A0A6A6AGV1_9PLEO|nr:DUF726-domain-containing protein [Dothidotthia symphoricarpi CBS 119687]KAF2131030.1 DUF726-domain-containing protein [Dothidotthia symphoricarpi CBS 119687]